MAQNAVTNTTYIEFTEDHRTWHSGKPDFDEAAFNKKLAIRGGTLNDVPRFRLRWAGSADEYLIEQGLRHVGYKFKQNGEEIFVSCANRDFEFPDDALVIPYHEDVRIFTPRWVIEEYGGTNYSMAWFVETVEELPSDSARVNLLSRYREPAEIDLEMAEGVTKLRLTLTPEQISEGLAREKELAERRKQHERDELKGYISDETYKALTDGIDKPLVFDMNRKFDIKEYAKKKTAQG